jgi:putative endonuclease
MKRASGDKIGRRAEARAEILLRLKGYQILSKRFRSGQGEIDLVAQRGRVVAFVEVKARTSEGEAIEAVGRRQRRRILAAANAFLAQHPRAAQKDCRFDIIIVTSSLLPRHILNAWSASDHNGN